MGDAYNLQPYQLSGPSWLTTEWFAVTAKLPPGTARDEYRQMMANLLSERFGLLCHRVTKDFSGYEIAVATPCGGGAAAGSRPRVAPETRRSH